jgi:hypothetical protein
MEDNEAPKVERVVDPIKESIRRPVRYFYDLQKLRIASGNRTADPDDYKIVPDKKDPTKSKKVKKNVSRAQMDEALMSVIHSVRGTLKNEEESELEEGEKPAPPTLDEEDRLYLQRQNRVLMSLEADTLERIKTALKAVPIATWLLEQKGIGPTLAGVLVSEVDITRCNTPSALWAYAGLHCDQETGMAVRRKKGVKSNWNPFLKTKLVKVLAECFIKSNSPWRSHYDNYKTRKTNQLVQVCRPCNGTGKVHFGAEGPVELTDSVIKAELNGQKVVKEDKSPKTCTNCNGTGGPAPWGNSGAHRDLAAKRFMVKAFLLEFWKQWRGLEGLEIVPSYAEAMLGRVHGDHGGAPVLSPKTQKPFSPAPRNQVSSSART